MFSGHHHPGNLKTIDGIHYYTLRGMVQGEDSAYAIVEITPDNSLHIIGFDRAVSAELDIPPPPPPPPPPIQDSTLPFHEDFTDPDKASVPGPLHSQHGWRASAGATVQADTGRNNSKALRLEPGFAENRFLNGTNVVTVSTWMKPVGYDGTHFPPDEATAVFWIDAEQYIHAYSNTTVVALPAQVPPDTYFDEFFAFDPASDIDARHEIHWYGNLTTYAGIRGSVFRFR